jgi:hypothetical protein
VLLVLDLAVGRVAKSRAQDADGGLAVSLDFEMDGRVSFDGSKNTDLYRNRKENYFSCMATFETLV